MAGRFVPMLVYAYKFALSISDLSMYHRRLPNRHFLAAVAIHFLLGFIPQNIFAQTALAGSTADPSVVESMDAGLLTYSNGAYVVALRSFARALEKSKQAHDIESQLDALLYLSKTYQVLGMKSTSHRMALAALPLLKGLEETARAASLYDRVGVSFYEIGNYEEAKKFLDDGIVVAQQLKDSQLLALLQNDLGNLFAIRAKYNQAIRAFEASLSLLDRDDNQQLRVIAGNNLAKALVESGVRIGLASQLVENLGYTRALANGREKADSFLAIGETYRRAQMKFGLPSAWRQKAHDAILEGLSVAEQLGDQRTISFALGYLGGLYEDEGRYTEALQYTRRASFAAQEANANESLYRWEWQIARLLRAQGDIDGSIVSYRAAIDSLQEIRSDLIIGTHATFRQVVGPVYFELADLLLRRATTNRDKDAIRRDLLEVRRTLEKAKVAEVEDYFQNECVLYEESATYLDKLTPNSAIIYPVLLSDRTDILVSLPKGLRLFSTKVDRKTLTNEVRKFRLGIETYDNQDLYLAHSKKLYDWLIAPEIQALKEQKIRTLVFVPDGPLRSIPMSALYDGKRFLIQRFAVATTPGLTLTNPHAIPRDNIKVLANGLTEAVQGFPALPSVSIELNNIQQLYPSATFKNKDFQVANVKKEMSEGSYSIVHIATHGQFDSDHHKSFLLTYDGKLTMDRLEQSIGVRRYQDVPLELLVLSACQTAAGDDRAALGLAGVAIKAGARSALATLWFINDQATSELVSEFYRQLKDKHVSKAQALQTAQLMLISNEKYRHPSYWAPFLLIGNWL